MPESIFHIAEPEIWRAQSPTGRYSQSTRGASLADIGFVHCSFRRQVSKVAGYVYADRTTPLVLLEIDPALVDAPLKVEALDGATEEFPHIYGPIPVTAVIAVRELVRDGETWQIADA